MLRDLGSTLLLLALMTTLGCWRGRPRPMTAPPPMAMPVAAPVGPPPTSGMRLVAPSPAPRCEPVQVGPNRWVTPLCESIPATWVRPFVGGSRLDGELPTSVDLRGRGLTGPVKDQEQVGVCWAFALSSVMDNAIRKGARPDTIAPLHVVAKQSWNALWQSTREAPALTLESRWHYDPRRACAFNDDDAFCGKAYGVEPGSWRRDPNLVHELEAADRAHQYRFHHVEQLEAKPANVDQLVHVLAKGDAIWAALEFDPDAWSFAALRSGIFGDYESSRSYGHAVALVGYRTVGLERQFLLQNSWGSDWADGGYAWMPAHVLERHLKSALRLRVTATRALPPPPPPRGECGPDSTRDLLTGRCVGRCPGGAVPIAGLCAPALPLPFPTTQATSCAAGEARDVVTGQCVPSCASGVAPVMGVCWL
ncbi:MAG: C1 family peptidase [Polyangiaceae bacterium]